MENHKGNSNTASGLFMSWTKAEVSRMLENLRMLVSVRRVSQPHSVRHSNNRRSEHIDAHFFHDHSEAACACEIFGFSSFLPRLQSSVPAWQAERRGRTESENIKKHQIFVHSFTCCLEKAFVPCFGCKSTCCLMSNLKSMQALANWMAHLAHLTHLAHLQNQDTYMGKILFGEGIYSNVLDDHGWSHLAQIE